MSENASRLKCFIKLLCAWFCRKRFLTFCQFFLYNSTLKKLVIIVWKLLRDDKQRTVMIEVVCIRSTRCSLWLEQETEVVYWRLLATVLNSFQGTQPCANVSIPTDVVLKIEFVTTIVQSIIGLRDTNYTFYVFILRRTYITTL